MFCKRLYNLCHDIVHSGKKYIKMKEDIKNDLKRWRKFCDIFNRHVLLESKITNPLYEQAVVSDSSKTGYGIYMGSDWLAGINAMCLILRLIAAT